VLRKGNLGYITKMSNAIIKLQSSQSEIAGVLKEVEGWSAYLDGWLSDQNKIETHNIGGYKPVDIFSAEPDELGSIGYDRTSGSLNKTNQLDD
jgi:hypothetical protein